MLQAMRRKMDDDKGFTLIELMVVVLIIAILIAIAIPTFLGLRRRAQDRAAQSDLRNGLTAAKAWFTDDDTYAGFNAAELMTIEPSLTADAAASSATTVPPFQVSVAVSVDAATGVSTVGLARLSASGTCFYVNDVSNGGTVKQDDAGAGDPCTGAQAILEVAPSTW